MAGVQGQVNETETTLVVEKVVVTADGTVTLSVDEQLRVCFDVNDLRTFSEGDWMRIGEVSALLLDAARAAMTRMGEPSGEPTYPGYHNTKFPRI